MLRLLLLRLSGPWRACAGRRKQMPCWAAGAPLPSPALSLPPPPSQLTNSHDLWMRIAADGVRSLAAWRRSTTSERATALAPTARTIGASRAFSRAFTAFTSRSSHRARICRRVSESLYRRLRLRPHTWWRARRPTQRLARSHRKWHRNWRAWYCEMRRGQNQREVSPGCHTMFSCADVHGLTRLGCPNRDRRGVRSGRRSVSSS